MQSKIKYIFLILISLLIVNVVSAYQFQCFTRGQTIPGGEACAYDCCHACISSSGYTTNPTNCAGLNDCSCSTGNNDNTTTCTESWGCTTWSSCANSVQTRICSDSNSCGTTANKPAESQSCTVQTPQNSSSSAYTLTCYSRGQTIPGGSSCGYDCCQACITSSGYTTLTQNCAGQSCTCNGGTTTPIEPSIISINSPVNGQTYYSGRVWLNVSLSKTVNSISYKLDSNSEILFCTNCMAPQPALIPASNIPDGKHGLKVKIVDGPNTTYAIVNFTTDATAPSIISILPEQNSNVVGKTQTPFSVTYTENNLQKVQLFYKSTGESSYKNVISNACLSGQSKTCIVNANLAAYNVNSTIQYYFTLTDNGNLNTNSATKSFLINETVQCAEAWTCNNWNACQSSSTRTRICSDSNSCGTTANKPAETESCTYSSGGSGGGSSGGGGGGSGGSGGDSTYDSCKNRVWDCKPIGECIKGLQNNTCKDATPAGKCATKKSDKTEMKNCTVANENTQKTNTTTSGQTTGGNSQQNTAANQSTQKTNQTTDVAQGNQENNNGITGNSIFDKISDSKILDISTPNGKLIIFGTISAVIFGIIIYFSLRKK